MMPMGEFKSGFAAIIGRPNVGKSTLLNSLVGQKIAIMSDKAQTTRNKIQGIYTTEESQIIFIDTPGIHKPKHRLGTFMVQSALSTLNEVDVLLFMVNATEKKGPGDSFIIEKIKESTTPVFLLINKIDEVHPDDLFAIIDSYKDEMNFAEIIPISAKKGNNVDTLIKVLTAYLPQGPQYYPEDQVTDHPEYFIMSELIREKVLHLTSEEIPHSIAVVIESVQRNEQDRITVHATIVVERASQKGIIIGKGGRMLKDIGTRARKEIEVLLGDPIYLDLWVKVQKDWRDKAFYLEDYGYRKDDY